MRSVKRVARQCSLTQQLRASTLSSCIRPFRSIRSFRSISKWALWKRLFIFISIQCSRQLCLRSPCGTKQKQKKHTGKNSMQGAHCSNYHWHIAEKRYGKVLKLFHTCTAPQELPLAHFEHDSEREWKKRNNSKKKVKTAITSEHDSIRDVSVWWVCDTGLTYMLMTRMMRSGVLFHELLLLLLLRWRTGRSVLLSM